jgi:hypothetical protein
MAGVVVLLGHFGPMYAEVLRVLGCNRLRGCQSNLVSRVSGRGKLLAASIKH